MDAFKENGAAFGLVHQVPDPVQELLGVRPSLVGPGLQRAAEDLLDRGRWLQDALAQYP